MLYEIMTEKDFLKAVNDDNSYINPWFKYSEDLCSDKDILPLSVPLGGIYQITSPESSKTFIGDSPFVEERISSDKLLLNRGLHYCESLQQLRRKYKHVPVEDLFFFNIILFSEDDLASNRISFLYLIIRIKPSLLYSNHFWSDLSS